MSSDNDPDDDLVEGAVQGILADAAAARHDGRLAAGYEDDLARRFDVIALEPEALERAVEAGELSGRQLYRFGRDATPTGADAERRAEGSRQIAGVLSRAARRSARAAKGISRRGTTTARRVAGPRLRSLERRSVDQAGRAAEALTTRGFVAADHARRVASSGGTSRRLDRLSPSGRALPSGTDEARSGASSTALGAPSTNPTTTVLEDWIVDRLRRSGGGRVLHVECGEGALVRRLAVAGFEATGADPATEPQSGTVTRAAALEHLGGQRRSSLHGLVLSGATERVSPGSARAFAHLASTRLQHGGIVVLVSPHPDRVGSADPISSDLAARRPLHPVTWCHLLARYGFGEITVFDPGVHGRHPGGAGALYAIAARRA